MKDGFIKVASISPKIKVGDISLNAERIIDECRKVAQVGAKIVVTPELCLAGATAGDLYNFESVQLAVKRELLKIANELKGEQALFLIGAPLKANGKLFSCAVAINCGEIIAVIPSNNLTERQKRWFSNGEIASVELGGEEIVVENLALVSSENPLFSVEVVFGSSVPTLGANIVANMSAEGKTYKSYYETDDIIFGASRLYNCAYIRAEAGSGESVTDEVYSANNCVIENGELLVSASDDESVITEIDAGYLEYIRKRPFEADYIEFSVSSEKTELTREIDELPFCGYGVETCIDLQAKALATRMENCNIKTAVIGLSGGLDSTLALLVTDKAFDILARDKKDIIAITMPCFGTTKRTKGNAQKLAEALGVTFKTVNITESVRRHLKEIGHDGVTTDVTYENAQARERTQVLMDIANLNGGMVIGTGDMSELALGWATYNGDHMSMYSVNAGVTKTMVRQIVEAVASESDKKLSSVLNDILATPVSPELLPAKDGEIAQITEDLVGPYELHDFFLYGLLARGNGARKLYRTAIYAFNGKYDEATIEKWLRVFIRRFFTQQFKRSCSPDGPKVTEISLSPRNGLTLATEVSAAEFLRELDETVNGEN